MTSPAYRTIQPKVTKIVPSSSIVGMIFETPEPCRVVSSDSDGIMQHSAFTWLLDGDQFITEPDLSSSSQLFNEELNHWIATLTPEQRDRAARQRRHQLQRGDEQLPRFDSGDAWRVRWADPRRPASFG